MLFFMINLAVSIGLTLLILVFLSRSLSVNWDMRNRRPLGYLMPVFLTAVLIFFCLTQSVPRLLDTVAVISDICPTDEINLAQDKQDSRIALPDGQVLHYSRLQFTFAAGKTYQITYTPNSHFIIEVTEIVESSALE